MYQYDYTNQAWLKDGRYVRCGHSGCYHGSFNPDPWVSLETYKRSNHSCFGTRHVGETPNLTAEVR